MCDNIDKLESQVDILMHLMIYHMELTWDLYDGVAFSRFGSNCTKFPQLSSWVTMILHIVSVQRIALVYCVVALIETYTTKLRPSTLKPGHLSIISAYRWQWWEKQHISYM